MGLLEKALRGTVRPEPEYTVRHEAPPKRPLPDLSLLSRQIDCLPALPDFSFAVFALLSQTLPSKTLALFAPAAGRLSLAAASGFPKTPEAPLAPGLRASLAKSQGQLTREMLAPLCPLMGMGTGKNLRGHVCGTNPEARGFWLWPEASPENDADFQAGLFSLLARISKKIGPLCGMSSPDPAFPGPDFFAGAGQAALIRIDLGPCYEDARLLYPGLKPLALASVMEMAANSFLRSAGRARLRSPKTLAVILRSANAIDAELALIQFKKSLQRSLLFFSASKPPQGRSLALLASSPGLQTKLSEFFAE